MEGGRSTGGGGCGGGESCSGGDLGHNDSWKKRKEEAYENGRELNDGLMGKME